MPCTRQKVPKKGQAWKKSSELVEVGIGGSSWVPRPEMVQSPGEQEQPSGMQAQSLEHARVPIRRVSGNKPCRLLGRCAERTRVRKESCTHRESSCRWNRNWRGLPLHELSTSMHGSDRNSSGPLLRTKIRWPAH